MKFCFNCGIKLSIGTEKFCPECGFKLERIGTESKDTSIEIKDTNGNVSGLGLTSSGIINGKEVGYTVNGNVINLHFNNLTTEVLDDLRKIMIAQTQLPATIATKDEYKKDLTKLAQLKETQEKITNILRDVKQIENKEGIQIQQIKAGDLQISTDDLFVKDALGMGTELFYDGQYSDALIWYEKAIATDPKNAEAWFDKGCVLYNLGEDKEAIRSYEKAIEINPDYVDAWYSKGIILGKLGMDDEALRSYEKAIKIIPDYADAWNNKGTILDKLGKDKEAIRSYENAVELEPDFAYAWYNKGIILEKLGMDDEALRSYEKAIKIIPDYADAWNNKGTILVKLGKYKEARKCYDKAKKTKFIKTI